ncbi:hypothetical protein D9M71_341930 [compost metagenome]
MLTVQAFTALQDPRALIERDAWAIVFHAYLDTIEGMHADAHFAQAQSIGVLQKIAEHFQQGALLDRDQTLRRQIEGNLYLFVAIDLVQRIAKALQHRLQAYLMAHQAALAQAGALQLVTDLLAHALDLGLQHPGLIPLLRALRHAFADPLQYRQWGFQAMGQIVEGIAITATLFALAVQQAVERAGQAQQFPWVLFTQAFAGSAFDLIQFLAQPAQCLQPPRQAGP